MSGQGPGSEVWAAKHLRLAVEAAGVALWSWNVETNRLTMDERAFELWGMDWAPEVSFELLSGHIHPADQDRVRLAFEATRLTTGPFEIDFRINVDDAVRWVSARGEGGDEGIIDSTMFGVFLDVTERKQAEESNELLAGEMSHRVKNLLSIATGLTNISYRSASTTHDMAAGLTDRLVALGRAHDLVRPQPGSDDRVALLGDLISVLLAPYDQGDADDRHIKVAVGRIGVGEAAATTMAMVIHELATNSLKYGALSCPKGRLEVKTQDDGDEMLLLTWAESGGPEITSVPSLHGFGNQMVERSLNQQFGGTLQYDWQRTGLVASLTLRKDRLAI
ncbi:sensor histidine kinase [Sandarakinorhabdus sp.]|uniref:sensor histidine kinase n=1 Tax=Sandarakinorhabdus sp. TaxID=1916663 RepID=UPI003F6FE8DF